MQKVPFKLIEMFNDIHVTKKWGESGTTLVIWALMVAYISSEGIKRQSHNFVLLMYNAINHKELLNTSHQNYPKWIDVSPLRVLPKKLT